MHSNQTLRVCVSIEQHELTIKTPLKRRFTLTNITPLNRRTADLPILCLSHDKDTTHFTPFKCWFVSQSQVPTTHTHHALAKAFSRTSQKRT